MSHTADPLLSRLGFAPVDVAAPARSVTQPSAGFGETEAMVHPKRMHAIRSAVITFAATVLLFAGAKTLGDYVMDQMLDSYRLRQEATYAAPDPEHLALMLHAENFGEGVQGE